MIVAEPKLGLFSLLFHLKRSVVDEIKEKKKKNHNLGFATRL